MTKSEHLCNALESSRFLRAAGAHHALSARLAEQAGFDAIWASSFEISATFGVPDMSLLSMAEYLSVATAMNEATGVPVIADCDSGFGDALNVAYMVRKYEAAGIAAVCIEDKPFPKINSFIDCEQPLLDPESFAHKIECAKRMRDDPAFSIIARTEAFIAEQGVDEAIRRAQIYVDAGADAVLVHSKDRQPVQLIEFMRRWDRDVPVIAIPTTYYEFSAAQMQQHGIRMAIYANHGLRAATRAMAETYAEILGSGSSTSVEYRISSLKELFELQGVDEWLRFDQP